MSGYNFPQSAHEVGTKPVLVGCRRCHHTWTEEVTCFTPVITNLPVYKYDVCDGCITNEDRERMERP